MDMQLGGGGGSCLETTLKECGERRGCGRWTGRAGEAAGGGVLAGGWGGGQRSDWEAGKGWGGGNEPQAVCAGILL